MTNTMQKAISLLTVVALFITFFFVIPPAEAATASAANEVTIVGTIIKTRERYSVDGPVSAYGFLPATLTTVTVGGKSVELTECGAGTTPELLGTNDLSSFVGITRAYTGTVAKSSTAPFKYVFVISSYADTPAPTYAQTMESYLTGLGYINVSVIEYSPGELAVQADTSDFRGHFYYYMHNGVWGELNAVIANADNTGPELDYGCQAPAAGGFAKAQKVASIFSQYYSGAITKDAAQKSLNSMP